MSISAISIVLDSPISPPTNKLVAIVMADWCNNEGGSLHPSMATIAKKVGISRSQAQRIVHGFVEMGLLSVIGNAAGGKPGVAPNYKLHLDRIEKLTAKDTGSTHATGSADATGRTHAQDGSHGCTGGVAPMRPKPSYIHQEPSKVARKRAPSFDASTIELPPSIPREVWAEWVADRMERRKPITSRGAAGQIQKLEDYLAQGHDPAAVIRHSIANGYQGLFPPKAETAGGHQRRPALHADDWLAGAV